jgi:hypothetical protein
MKIKSLLYCTKAKPILVKNVDGTYTTTPNLLPFDTPLNGKIACECEADTEEINSYHCDGLYTTKSLDSLEILKHSCLKLEELDEYLMKGRDITDYDTIFGNALHLSNVKERVMELSECYTKKIEKIKVLGSPYGDLDSVAYHFEKSEVLKPVTKAPQNMMWVYVKENGKWEKRLLISVRPQWLCKILNGEKDIEVRRKVLKGMVE